MGYSIADVLAKPIFGLLAFAIATIKTRQDLGVNEDEELLLEPTGVTSTGLRSGATD